jgi:hypothetical protein
MNIDWAAVGAIANVGTLLAIPISVWFYIASKRSDKSAELDAWDRFYTILDEQYSDILRLVIERPYLSDQAQTRTAKQELEYQAFAFMVWNFIESIYDYCYQDEGLSESWHPVLVLESAKHASWFADPRSRLGFKHRFTAYIDNNGYCPNPTT